MTADVVQAIYTSLVLGSTYAVMAMGLTLVWGGLRFLNLAYGALFVVGAYGAFAAVSAGAPMLLGLVAAFVAAGAVGGVIHLGVFKPILKRPDAGTATLVAGLGLALAIQAAIVIRYSYREHSLPDLISGKFRLPGGVVATGSGLLIVVTAVAVLLLLAWFLARTRYGIGIRALAFSRDGAELLGIDTNRLVLFVMILGGGLAGFSGALLTSVYFVSVAAGYTALVKALIVTIAGGLGNVRGTLVAAYAVAIVETVVSLWIGTQWALPIEFGLVLLLLVLRPQGIAGRVSFEGGA